MVEIYIFNILLAHNYAYDYEVGLFIYKFSVIVVTKFLHLLQCDKMLLCGSTCQVQSMKLHWHLTDLPSVGKSNKHSKRAAFACLDINQAEPA